VVTVAYKTGLEIWGTPPLKKLAAQNVTILARFGTTSQLDRKYLQTGTRYEQSENGVVICEHSHTCLLNLVNVGAIDVLN